MNLRQAAEMALECLEFHWDHEETDWEAHPDHVVEAKRALREALAQPICEWVGLSDEEIQKLQHQKLEERWLYVEPKVSTRHYLQMFARAIEAKLKEKNCDS